MSTPRVARVLSDERLTCTWKPTPGEPFTDYQVTVSRGAKTYEVATVTTYADGSFYAKAYHDKNRLDITRKAWARILDHAGVGTSRYDRQTHDNAVRSMR